MGLGDVYKRQSDISGNLQEPDDVQFLAVTTLGAVSEVAVVLPVEVTEDSASVSLTLSRPADVYMVLLPVGFAPPSAVDVRDGSAAGTIQALRTTASAGDAQISVNDLTIATPYDLYIVTVNNDGVLLLEVVMASFVTAGDIAFPSFVSGYPRFVNIRDTSVTAQVKLSEAGTVSYVILPDDTAGPTVQAVHGRTAGGALAVGTITVDTADTLTCLLYTSPSPRDATLSRMPSSA